MTKKNIFHSTPFKKWRLFFIILTISLCNVPVSVYAHQTPTTIVLLDVSPGKVAMELQLPLTELELAFGHEVTKDPQTLIERLGPQLKEYLAAHIHAFVTKENPWLLEVTQMKVDKTEQAASGPPYWEIVVQLNAIPPAGVSTRKFILDYDVIMHQVINHAAFVSIRNDWETGKTGEQLTEAGIIRWDTKDNIIYPLQINLDNGSWWKGFKSIVSLGMQHIKEGTDHLLFLLVLLLPAMLLVNGKHWGKFGGTKYSIVRLLKIVTAFTIGHSITLLVGASGWLHLPTQPVEILIAFSILISAIHAVYPIFPGKEVYVAAGFGLIHGLAFASILANLNLGGSAMALSILGFNIGIELMQLLVITLIVPWLILLSQTTFYKWLRIGGAVLAAIAALAWIAERSSGESNVITVLVQNISPYAKWCIITLAVIAVSVYLWQRAQNKKDNNYSKIIKFY
jgi:HupE / UreJ protein